MRPAPSPAVSELLHALAQQPGRDRVSVRDLIDALGDRALGALLFLFAFPSSSACFSRADGRGRLTAHC